MYSSIVIMCFESNTPRLSIPSIVMLSLMFPSIGLRGGERQAEPLVRRFVLSGPQFFFVITADSAERCYLHLVHGVAVQLLIEASVLGLIHFHITFVESQLHIVFGMVCGCFQCEVLLVAM